MKNELFKAMKDTWKEFREKHHIIVMGVIVVFVIVLGVIVYLTVLNSALSMTSTYTYSGELISYEQQDLLHGGYLMDHTVLRFADGKTFRVDGSGVYAIGMNYTLTVEQTGPWTKVTSIRAGR